MEQLSLLDHLFDYPAKREVFQSDFEEIHVRSIKPRYYGGKEVIYTNKKPSKSPQFMKGMDLKNFKTKLENGDIWRVIFKKKGVN